MKFSGSTTLASIVCSAMIPVASAQLGISCLATVSALTELPGRFIEHLQRESCAAGCHPTPQTWNHVIKEHIIGELVEDGADYCDAHDTKEAFTAFLDKLVFDTAEKCQDKLQDKHLCHDREAVQPFVDCVDRHAQSAVAGSLPSLVRFLNEERCKKATEYFTGDQLWERDFPEHIKDLTRALPWEAINFLGSTVHCPRNAQTNKSQRYSCKKP
ncbi:hypothetical protein P168DRAFT_306141 [Aspergillus campestris IBT 28561]|uniref:Uncharacterized protein n=1 Tax=Aspergillus campestris (strain IBT 28561) TaxID=1392248 RepID=A0A2I1CW88_ASPC2|nr:uncharacterized protein P168DRAFT_306141 [Aspergillus campestris IBT 28561]PKY01891.1 hypothetical protein P168DRAFT_306141 [Aspergillus campestris IBT 28561]